MNTPMRGLRIPDDLWAAAKAEADRTGYSISEVVRWALECYLAPEATP